MLVRHLIATQFCEAKSNVLWTFGEDTRVSGRPKVIRESEDRKTVRLFQVRHYVGFGE
jgi:hypothetical protein